MESMSLGLIILLVGGVASLLIRIFKSPPNKTDNLATPSINIIKPKIAFAGSYVFCKDKIIVKDLGLFDEENLSAIQGFIRSISPSALELHPVFDHTLIGQDGVYKYWWFLPDGKNKDVSIRIQITCLDRKGKVIFHFTKGHNVYSDFVFNGEETLLNKTFYMELDYPEDRKLEFSNEEWLKQKKKPVLVKITFRPDRLPPVPDKYGHTLQEHDITYYDYFLFMDRLIKIEKTIGDSEKKEELIREFYQREKAAGGFYFEELREKEEGDQEGYADEQRRIPEAVKMEVWRRDGGKCSKCGSRVKLEYDHIIPFSMGGSNTARNIELLCMDCNRKKSNRV